MENIIYNGLLIRGFNVEVSVVEHSERDDNGKAIRKRLEVASYATAVIKDTISSLLLPFLAVTK